MKKVATSSVRKKASAGTSVRSARSASARASVGAGGTGGNALGGSEFREGMAEFRRGMLEFRAGLDSFRQRSERGDRNLAEVQSGIKSVRKMADNLAEVQSGVKSVRKMADNLAEVQSDVKSVRQQLANYTVDLSGQLSERQLAEMQSGLKSVRDQLGDWTQSEGDVFEVECAVFLKNARSLGGVDFDEIAFDLRRDPSSPQYDFAAINGKIVLVCEAKRTLRMDDVRDFAKRQLPRFPEDFPEVTGRRKVVGALFCKRVSLPKRKRGVPSEEIPPEERDPVALARSLGLMVVRAVGKNRMEVLQSAPVRSVRSVRSANSARSVRPSNPKS